MLAMLIDPENTDDSVRADSANAGKCIEELLNPGGFESCINEKAAAITRLATQSKSVTVLNQLSEPVLNIFLSA